MDTRQLSAFCEVVDRKSFSQAAERLGVTQPAERLEAIRGAMVAGVRRYADGEDFVLPIVARVISARAGTAATLIQR